MIEKLRSVFVKVKNEEELEKALLILYCYSTGLHYSFLPDKLKAIYNESDFKIIFINNSSLIGVTRDDNLTLFFKMNYIEIPYEKLINDY